MPKAKTEKWELHVICMDTGEVVRKIPCSSDARIRETALRGLLRNMNTDRYCVDEVQV